ncbi:hypothetical protein RJ640_013951 [Escallonia rubra]|uniref:Uncharacterized protein n=1 Tax=Escallonia rubra TaxID=112253 RepID=A0AA88UA94_9ASTE|nr:hypothetical protein RJ640_013951 [Escallonia rubra]
MDDSESGILMKVQKAPSNPIDNVEAFRPVKFPESKSCATSTGRCAGLDVLVDHMMLPEALASTRIPGSLMSFNSPEMSIPMYLFLEIPGRKNPISKLPPEETMVSPSLID